MNDKIKLFLKNFSYALTSNFISFAINAFIIIGLPKVIGETEYSYIQYYTLLATYVLLLHFGWIDGIYLRYGGRTFESLPKKRLSNQFWYIVIFSLIQVIIFSLVAVLFARTSDKYFIYCYLILSILIVLPKVYTSVILQATNRMKAYSVITIAEKAVYAFILVLLLVVKVKDVRILLISDLLGKLAAMIYGVSRCKGLILNKLSFAKEDVDETVLNVKAGVFLVLSNLCNGLVTGFTQLLIENKWGIETFGKVAITFNISRMLTVVINTVGVVLFPMIKTVRQEALADVYMQIRKIVTTLLFFALFGYYPLKIFFCFWLPNYSDSLKYAALLLPMCVFESKAALLASTYLKALRKEMQLFYVNILVVLINVIIACVFVYGLKNLPLAVLSITVTMMLKSFFMEYEISRVIKINIKLEMLYDVILSSIFILSTWYIDSALSVIIYFIAYSVYIVINKDDIIHIISSNKKRKNYD